MTDPIVPLKIYDNVSEYFKRNNMNYDVQEIIPNGSPFNHNLYIVIAKHTNYPESKKSCGGGPWVVWSCWNEVTQCLNHGHYDILDYDKAYALAMDLSAQALDLSNRFR